MVGFEASVVRQLQRGFARSPPPLPFRSNPVELRDLLLRSPQRLDATSIGGLAAHRGDLHGRLGGMRELADPAAGRQSGTSSGIGSSGVGVGHEVKRRLELDRLGGVVAGGAVLGVLVALAG